MNMNQITLPVRDVEAAAHFYRELGFTQIVQSETYARFECPNRATFSLVLDDSEFLNGAVIYFEEENLDDWVRELMNRGIKFDQMPKDMEYLWREAILHDPSGNKIKLYWAGKARLYPPWRVEIRGVTRE